MDIIDINQEINKKIIELDNRRIYLKKKAEEKAQANADYEKSLAIAVLKLKNNAIDEFEGEQISKNMPANLIDRIARGLCYNELNEKEKTEAYYKALIVEIQTIQAQLNALQSLFRHLDRG